MTWPTQDIEADVVALKALPVVLRLQFVGLEDHPECDQSRSEAAQQEAENDHYQSPVEEFLPLTVPGVTKLVWKIVWGEPPSSLQTLKRSWRRRRHQAHAKRSQYKHRQLALTG